MLYCLFLAALWSPAGKLSHGVSDQVWYLIVLIPKQSEYDQEYHNHKPQTNAWHRKEEPHNRNETPGRQTLQSKQLSLPLQDDCKTRMDIK